MCVRIMCICLYICVFVCIYAWIYGKFPPEVVGKFTESAPFILFFMIKTIIPSELIYLVIYIGAEKAILLQIVKFPMN